MTSKEQQAQPDLVPPISAFACWAYIGLATIILAALPVAALIEMHRRNAFADCGCGWNSAFAFLIMFMLGLLCFLPAMTRLARTPRHYLGMRLLLFSAAAVLVVLVNRTSWVFLVALGLFPVFGFMALGARARANQVKA